MANKPSIPPRGYDFGDFQTVNPTQPPPGQNIDQELDAIVQALQGIVAWCNTAIQDDGGLIAATQVAQNVQTATTLLSQTQAARDIAVQKAADAAASVALATAIAGGNFPAANTVIAALGNIQSTNVQAAIYELDTEKLAVAASGAFGRTLLASNTLADATTALGVANLALVPTGAVIPMAANVVPSGYLACNGQTVSRLSFANLFAVLGTTYGAGDGSTTFRLPDLRGEFVRGHDDGRGVDTGRVFGSTQGQDVQPHNHLASSSSTASTTVNSAGSHAHTSYDYYWALYSLTFDNNDPAYGYGWNVNPNALNNVARSTEVGGAHSHSASTSVATTTAVSNSTGTETRPRNVALLYCIKT